MSTEPRLLTELCLSKQSAGRSAVPSGPARLENCSTLELSLDEVLALDLRGREIRGR
ncbi:hypothetical protein [Flavimobilis marinus]|uniref:hypothetical protein n=1 Tax=Flavimobilis marinus TaxID=285351 RepID=UPI0015A61853|nr:hypothetical protein [Flavimobilis marinus]